MSTTLHVVCVECREESAWGGAFHDGTRWRIDPYPKMDELCEAFLFAHRGHVLGVVETGTLETSEKHGLISRVESLQVLLSTHPGDELDDAERVAEPSDLLRGLLGAEY
jgi:hypothetical protein